MRLNVRQAGKALALLDGLHGLHGIQASGGMPDNAEDGEEVTAEAATLAVVGRS